MKNFRRTFLDLLADRRGATAIEYGMIAGLVIVGILAALSNFSAANDANYDLIEDNLTG